MTPIQHPIVFRIGAVALGVWLLAASASFALEFAVQSDPAQRQQAQRISQLVAAQDWLGPISAVALSPFFGLACLSGMATYGPDWLRGTPLLAHTGPLNSPILFWTMAALTLITSLPRWNKFSKPVAMALESVEAYSAIIILIVLRFAASIQDGSPVDIASSGSMHVEAGILSLPFEILLSIALAINVIVVNTIKMVIDLFVWMIPVPAVDAVLEGVGKLLTGGLLGLYAVSPTIATVINLAILFLCSLVFFAAKRWLAYFREIYFASVIDRVLGNASPSSLDQRVFLASSWNGYPRRTRAQLVTSPDGMSRKLTVRRWFSVRTYEIPKPSAPPDLGIVADTLSFTTDAGPLALEARKGVFVPLDSKPPVPLSQKA